MADKKEKRDVQDKIRYTKSEFEEIKKRVPRGETRAGWIRRILLEQEPPKNIRRRLSAPKVAPQLMRELGQIGGNINQIARTLNTAKKSGDPISLVQIFSLLQMIEKNLEEIKHQNTRV